jgi:hypothetical protein
MVKWIAGVTLGAFGSLIGTIIYLIFKNFYNPSASHATGLAVVKAQTLWSPVWWCGVFLMMAASITFVRSPAWLLKVTVLGLAAFFVGFVLFNIATSGVTGGVQRNTAIGLSAVFE